MAECKAQHSATCSCHQPSARQTNGATGEFPHILVLRHQLVATPPIGHGVDFGSISLDDGYL